MGMQADGSFTVFHKEYVQDIVSSTNFTKQDFALNPGVMGSFPWLAQISDAYEEYRFDGIIWEYKSMYSVFQGAGGAGAFGSLGTVIMGTNYNVNQDPFTDKRSMENYEGSTSKNPTEHQRHAVECRGNPVNKLWVRTNAPTEADYDLRLYDLGRTSVAVQGMVADGQMIGELWVTYMVTFFKPRYRTGGAQTDHYTLYQDPTNTALGNMAGTLTAAAPFGTQGLINKFTPTLTRNNPSNGIFGIGTQLLNGTNFSFPKHTAGRQYKMTFMWESIAPNTLQTTTAQMQVGVGNGAQVVTKWSYGNQDWTGQQVPCPIGGLAGVSNQRFASYICMVLMPQQIDPDQLPFVTISSANNPNQSTGGLVVDIYIEEVNPIYYTKNF